MKLLQNACKSIKLIFIKKIPLMEFHSNFIRYFIIYSIFIPFNFILLAREGRKVICGMVGGESGESFLVDENYFMQMNFVCLSFPF